MEKVNARKPLTLYKQMRRDFRIEKLGMLIYLFIKAKHSFGDCLHEMSKTYFKSTDDILKHFSDLFQKQSLTLHANSPVSSGVSLHEMSNPVF